MLLLLAAAPLRAAAPNFQPLTKPPLGDRWFGIYFNDERTGFVHVTIGEAPAGYRIESESAVKMSGLGFSREASVRESYIVNRDLTLASFQVTQTIDGSPMKLSGEVRGKTVRVTVESAGNRKEKSLTAKGAVYPPAVLNLYPLFLGATAGRKYRVSMLDVEAVAVKEVRITALKFEKLDGRDALHLRNNLYPFVDNDVWVDLTGNTLRESVRDGWIETRSEDEGTARAHLSEAALSKKDMILDFSLVPVDRPIDRSAELRFLELELSGFPGTVPLLQDPFQKAERREGGTVLFTLDTRLLMPPATPPVGEPADMRRYLEPSDRILADNPEIVRRAAEILGEVKDRRAALEKLVRWVADYVKDSVTDSQTPLETLQKRTGNCQSHARLYASLARAAGIPTRFVSGLVYAPGKGFLYHSWAESYLGYWLPVDPTFGQVPADATHVKLVEGDAPDDLAPLAGVIGAIKGRVVKTEY
jgi:transglutaminase-like putative cysteine protease